MHRIRHHIDLRRDRHLRHRRQPGRQRHLRRRTPGPAHHHGHPGSPVDLTVSAPALGYVHDSGHVSAVGGASGNPVVLTGAGTCTLSGTTVTYTAPGSCVITANRRHRTLHRRPPGPPHHHGQEEAPGHLLLRPSVGGSVVLGVAVGHRRRLRQACRAHLRYPRGLPRVRKRGDLHPDGHMRHRRQPGRRRPTRRPPGPALDQGHPDTPVPRNFFFFFRGDAATASPYDQNRRAENYRKPGAVRVDPDTPGVHIRV